MESVQGYSPAPSSLGMHTPSPHEMKELRSALRTPTYLLPTGDHAGSVSKLPVRSPLPRPASSLTRSRPPSQFQSSCSMVSLKQRKVYLVDFNAVVAKATGFPLKITPPAIKSQNSPSPTHPSPMQISIEPPSAQPSPTQQISSDSSPVPPLIKCDNRSQDTVDMAELLQFLKLKQQGTPPPLAKSLSMGSTGMDAESIPETSSQPQIRFIDASSDIQESTSLPLPVSEPSIDEAKVSNKAEVNGIVRESSPPSETTGSIIQAIEETFNQAKEIIDTLTKPVTLTVEPETQETEIKPEISAEEESVPPKPPMRPVRPPRPKLRSSPARKPPPERPPLPKNVPLVPKTPPERPPYPSHLMDVFLPKGESGLFNITQFLEDRPEDKSKRYLGMDLWPSTTSEDSLQWGEPCIRRRPRVPPRPRFMAGSHGDVNINAALSNPPVSFAKSIDNMHLCEYISQSAVREGILASVEALQNRRRPPLSSGHASLVDESELQMDDEGYPSFSFFTPTARRRRSKRRAIRGRSMDDEFYRGSPRQNRSYLDDED